ncbi:MAG: AMP-binding protein [Actinomycetota bacterium]|nr:AMP-binding protein [Actinomycetota bacterium]
MTSDPLTAVAGRAPDRPAVVDDRRGLGGDLRVLDFAALDALTNRIANGLDALGVEPGSHVAWCGQNSLELIAMLHACRKAGVVSVPLNYRLADEELAYVLADCDAVAAVVDAAVAGRIAAASHGAPRLRHLAVFGGEPPAAGSTTRAAIGTFADLLAGDEPPDPARRQGPTTSMIYTSGTTGRPKGALKPAGDPAQLDAFLDLVHYDDGGVFITTGPLYHSGPNAFAGRAQGRGMTVVTQYRFDPLDWLRLVEEWGVTATFSAPTPVRRICALDDDAFAAHDVSSMRSMVANAAPWPQALKEAYLARFPADSLREVYGATELGIITLLDAGDQLTKPASCGKVLPLVELELRTDDGGVVDEPFEPGEIWVRASSVLAGYHNAPDKFAEEHDPDGWHTVGDIAYRDDEDYLYVCDRRKDVIISGGVNIYPAEIEAVLERHPDVFEATVFGIPSDEWGEAVHAVVEARRGDLDAAEVIAFARTHLTGYKVPRSVDFVTELPRTGSGKVLKRQLRAPYWEGTGRLV